MYEFFFAPENMPFMVAFGVMVVIGILEVATAVFGLGVSELVDSLLPDPDIDVDIDLDVTDLDLGDVAAHGFFTKLLGWLRIGRVPVLILLVVYLFGFGFVGLVLQSLVAGATGGFLLPWWIAVWPACAAGLVIVHYSGGALAMVIPKDETEVVSERKFIGRVAVITLGKASAGSPAEARLKDTYGRTHYVMLEPDEPGVSFEQGEAVLIVGREGSVFRAIVNPSGALVDDQEPA